MSKIIAIIPAGGSGQRMGLPRPKQFYELAGSPVLVHTLKAFQRAAGIDGIIVVAPADYLAEVEAMVASHGLDRVE
ncbi:MAG: 2-C-methyl-D-erythritol 4-phosphate cytidylyltransferase, partial [Desulfobulbaceae bacterium]|nr:2-C-methyl-D-erythritol 4-phosphate cytidylyltransferase [Desulfobulbaceae bacterium]